MIVIFSMKIEPNPSTFFLINESSLFLLFNRLLESNYHKTSIGKKRFYFVEYNKKNRKISYIMCIIQNIKYRILVIMVYVWYSLWHVLKVPMRVQQIVEEIHVPHVIRSPSLVSNLQRFLQHPLHQILPRSVFHWHDHFVHIQ